MNQTSSPVPDGKHWGNSRDASPTQHTEVYYADGALRQREWLGGICIEDGPICWPWAHVPAPLGMYHVPKKLRYIRSKYLQEGGGDAVTGAILEGSSDMEEWIPLSDLLTLVEKPSEQSTPIVEVTAKIVEAPPRQEPETVDWFVGAVRTLEEETSPPLPWYTALWRWMRS